MRARDLGVQASPTCLRGEATHQRETTPRSGHTWGPAAVAFATCDSYVYNDSPKPWNGAPSGSPHVH